MMKKIIISFAWTLAFAGLQPMCAQSNGSLMGHVADEENQPVPGAMITLVTIESHVAFGGSADPDGRYRINGIAAGSYDVHFKMQGKSELVKKGVVINPDKISVLDVVLKDSALIGNALIIEDYAVPLIDPDGGTFTTLTAKEMTHLPSAHGGNIKKIVMGMLSDVKSSANGEELYFRGSRAGSVIYYIDGVKVRENVPNIPSSGIATISVYTGGMPATYGDTTGGVVVINTKSFVQEYYQKLNAAKKQVTH
jgi:Carboxypeptidase regulatory-like domain/TonB-dependent Receptor Plug Domain